METENGWISRRMEGFNLLEFSGIYHRSLLEVNSRKRNGKNKIDDLMIIDTWHSWIWSRISKLCPGDAVLLSGGLDSCT